MTQPPLPIICVSYNSCVDRILEVNSFKPGEPNKATFITQQAAGKAITIAYILNFLGISCEVYGYIGNDYVELFQNRLKNITQHLKTLEQRTRVNTTLIDVGGKETHVRENGSPMEEETFRALIDQVVEAGSPGQWVVLSGSLPPGIPPKMLADFIHACKKKQMKVAVDSSGEALRCAVDADPDLIKPNRDELIDLVGEEAFYTFGIIQSADRLRFTHPTMDILISDGSNGCYYVSGQGRKHALFESDFTVPVYSTVGAGDALLAGFLCGVSERWGVEQCLRYAVRVATSTLPCLGAGEMSIKILFFDPLNVRIEQK